MALVSDRKSCRFTMVLVMALTLCLAAGRVDAQDWEVTTSSVTELTRYSGNTGAFWGYHQPILVRAGSRFYAGLLQSFG
jgi:hypothetical protein